MYRFALAVVLSVASLAAIPAAAGAAGVAYPMLTGPKPGSVLGWRHPAR